jgi:PPOX class probable F420-dependent enzyme
MRTTPFACWIDKVDSRLIVPGVIVREAPRCRSVYAALLTFQRSPGDTEMPKGPVPDRYRDILQSTAVGHLATIAPSGLPQVNPVWFMWDGEHVFLSIKPDTVKYRNLRANPNVVMSVSDLSRLDRYVEIRGTVTGFELFDNVSWVNQLARKHTGSDFAGGHDGEHRYKVTVRINSWTAQN